MPRGVRENFKKRLPKLEELGNKLKVPEVPRAYRKALWRTIKVRTTLKLPEETEHFMNLLCLHFGLSRNDLVLHAINLLWTEVLQTVEPERIKMYEDKLEAVRLYRLEKHESRNAEKQQKLHKAIIEWHRQGYGGKVLPNPNGITWSYDHTKPVRKWKLRERPVVVVEEEDEVAKGD